MTPPRQIISEWEKGKPNYADVIDTALIKAVIIDDSGQKKVSSFMLQRQCVGSLRFHCVFIDQ